VFDTKAIAKKTGAALVSNYEICMYYAKKGIEAYHPMNTGGSYATPDFTIKSVLAVHSSSFDDGTYGGLAGGFIVSSKEGSFYYAGDTALYSDMKLIGEEQKLNFAMLPVGDNFTMGAADAIKASDLVKCNTIIAMHYNTFELIKIDTATVTKQFEKAGKKITFLPIGETKDF
jgi:L-ascorbate metabolism protein UlaG (beta-lactamase superfamily)